jgi:processive 1,2-diacylglycerol beta-glucosyltransferase
MPKLYDAETDKLLGTITPEELQYLIDLLEEEDSEDRDYYIDRATLGWFQEHGADATLETMLRAALGDRDGMDIRWSDD